MSNPNAEDNWSQLLSDFGIQENPSDTKSETKPVKETAPDKRRKARAEETRQTVPSEEAVPVPQETAGEDSGTKEKRSFFSRFPKISFFGVPPQPSSDSVAEGSPPNSFTGSKLEKMPVDLPHKEKSEGKGGKYAAQKGKKADPYAVVAAQIDTLADAEYPSRRSVPSMFDEPTPEPEEMRNLKNLIGEQPDEDDRADSGVDEEFRQNRGHRRGRGQGYLEGSAPRGRGSRYPSADSRAADSCGEETVENYEFEPVLADDDDFPDSRPPRSRRGTRYSGNRREEPLPMPAENDLPQEEWSEVDEALQASHARSSRRPRYERPARPPRTESAVAEDAAENEDTSGEIVHRNIPSWEEAVDELIAGNITRHKSHRHQPGRPYPSHGQNRKRRD
ncbi:MAG: hypothetical protein LBH00_04105 [Planctomycetaceae bacterium]|jgi:hypothetical protein|nr:hypothetical protein [Planctomycetaceae bacterium]